MPSVLLSLLASPLPPQPSSPTASATSVAVSRRCRSNASRIGPTGSRSSSSLSLRRCARLARSLALSRSLRQRTQKRADGARWAMLVPHTAQLRLARATFDQLEKPHPQRVRPVPERFAPRALADFGPATRPPANLAAEAAPPRLRERHRTSRPLALASRLRASVARPE